MNGITNYRYNNLMSMPDQNNINMPAEAVAELSKGNTIEAIKIIRGKTGLGLKEAKDLVDHYSGGNPGKTATQQVSGSFEHGQKSGQMNLPATALAELTNGNKIGAIKIVREVNASGLKDAKDFVEQYIDGNPSLKAKINAAQVESLRGFLNWLIPVILLIGLCIYIFASK